MKGKSTRERKRTLKVVVGRLPSGKLACWDIESPLWYLRTKLSVFDQTLRKDTLMTLQVSWVRHRDIHLLTIGQYTYTNDQRFRAIHKAQSEDWTLQIKYPQHRDSGIYECQVSTTPHMSHFVHLNVIAYSLYFHLRNKIPDLTTDKTFSIGQHSQLASVLRRISNFQLPKRPQIFPRTKESTSITHEIREETIGLNRDTTEKS
ncbi:zwei Ig domain protein zig-8-like isoform X1 [Vespula squamosa]|uniref:Zwei Ig domain protein zig-8-like isoform X1 n=1 Tax=Vespula squamosa TaxID=30214 RepID=A0ABD2AXK2_VESSQ